MASREMQLASFPPGTDLPRGRLPALRERLIGPFRRGVSPPPRPATGFYTDTTVCIGCKACEVACKQWNQLPSDGFNWTGNSYDNTGDLSATSWRHVKFIEQFPNGSDSTTTGEPSRSAPAQLVGPSGHRFSLEVLPNNEPTPARWLMMSDVCKHCVTAPCQQACP